MSPPPLLDILFCTSVRPTPFVCSLSLLRCPGRPVEDHPPQKTIPSPLLSCALHPAHFPRCELPFYFSLSLFSRSFADTFLFFNPLHGAFLGYAYFFGRLRRFHTLHSPLQASTSPGSTVWSRKDRGGCLAGPVRTWFFYR